MSVTQPAPALDEVERQIIAALRVDGRRSWRDIARQIGTSESTVARRARSLMESGVFRTTIAVDPQRCGFGYPVVFRLICDFGKASEVASALSARPDIRFVVHVAGEFDVLAELIVASSKHLAQILIEEFPQIPGIHRVATSTVLRRFLPQHDWTGLDISSWIIRLPEGQSWPLDTVELDELDLRVIAVLQRDCRSSLPKLANEVGVGESIVRRRLEVLIESGAIRPTALVEPKALGFEIELFVSIRCELGQLERVAQALRAVPTVRFLSATTGVYDLVAEVVLRAEADIYDFYTHTLGTIPGLAGVDMAVEIRTVKRGFIPL